GLAADARDAGDARRLAARVIEQHQVAGLHRAHVVARLEVAHAVPGTGLLLGERVDRVDLGLAHHQPVVAAVGLGHDTLAYQVKKRSWASAGSSMPVTRAFCTS